MTADGTRTFEWDARNQLVAVNVGTHRSEFTYDGMQRRVRIVERQNGVIESDTRLVWCETVVCEERASNGFSVLRRAFALGEQVEGVNRFFMLDHLGSPAQVTDATGALLVRYEYDPLGSRTLVAGTASTSIGFTGHQHHEPSGLNLTLYRAYDPGMGRWISSDPMGLRGGLNLYAYVANNPLKLVDPTGAASLTVTGPTLTPAAFLDQVTVYCSGRVGWGCTKTNVVIDCDCSYDALECKWRAKVDIKATINVFYLDNPKAKYSAATIIGEEFKHVRLIRQILWDIKNRGDNLEYRRFDYKFTCLAACGIYRLDSYMRLMLQGPVVHHYDPHPE
jgi:RHS repeat-associated protein